MLCILGLCEQGRPSPPKTMMHFSLLFQIFPLFSKNFRAFRKMLTILPFPDKFLHFHPPKFLMTFFLVIHHKFRISSLFSLFQYMSPPVSRELLFPPAFQNFPLFIKIHLLFTYFLFISFPPYFDHDAVMHHPMHILDASANRGPRAIGSVNPTTPPICWGTIMCPNRYKWSPNITYHFGGCISTKGNTRESNVVCGKEYCS